MTTFSTDPAEIQHYFDLLFPDAPPNAYVVLSGLSQGKLLSRWLSPSQIPQICGPLATQATHSDMYINLGLRHPDCTPRPETRGDNEDVYAIGGLWVDCDHNGGRHSAKNLPSPDELLTLIQSLPLRFSLLVDSSGGYHCYALFKELWILDTPAERDAAALLLKRFQRTIQIQAATHGWKVDSTADLARVLRPAGTLNHKSGTPKPVTIAHEDPIRYNPSDIADASWLATIEDTYTPSTGTGDFPPTQLEPIVAGCTWLRHCLDDAATLPEPEWYGMLGIVGRCVDGAQIAHEWSVPYPRYSKDETARKLTHALADAGPRTCSTIRFDLGGDDCCRDCQHWGKIKSPIVLGMHTRRRNGQNQGDTIPPGAPPHHHTTDTEKELEGALPYSDYTNALALVREHGQNLRYCYPWKSWLVWTGTHWQRDDTGSVHQAAKRTIKRLAQHAEDLDDDTAVKALMAHVKKSLSKASLDAMVRTAQDEPGIPVKPEALDMDPWLLNCTNGTLDLRTGTLRPQRQADLITKCLPIIAYDPHAQCPTWEHFLWRIMGGSQGEDHPDMGAGELENRCKADDRARALIDFLQRAIGYTLTGSTREQCIFILHGKTKTGKSTFLATLRALIGPYGQQADMSSFMHKDRDEVRNDLADLAGSRFVCALESQEGRRLAESLVKQLTGGVDLYKARFLFQEHFTFKPQFKIFLGTNHKPLIKDTDSAIWERIRLVPFDIQIPKPERDKTLDERLQQELPGMLAWAVRGCLEWQRLGELGEPKAVITATAQYRSDMDTIARFLEECCIVDKPEIAKVKASVLASAYQAWCKRTGEVPLANRDLITDLEERGYKRARGTANQYYWHGLGLVNTEEERYE